MYDAEVAVVGQGPVGALAALLLGRLGVDCVALDRRREVYPLPRAVAADEEVQRMLRAAGLAEAVARMRPAHGARFKDRHGRAVLEVRLPGSGSGLPALALFRQPDLEAAIRARVDGQPGVRLLLGREGTLVDLAQDATGVDLRMLDGSRLRVRLVLACDGAASPVRQLLGVAFTGGRFRQQWLVVDTLSGGDARTPGWVDYHCDPGRPAVVIPGRLGTRVELLLTGADADRRDLGVAEAAARVAGLLPVRDRVERAACYTFAVRTARRWRVGRVLLAGDAAHTLPPFAGQGLAAGIRDVTNLAWKLRLVSAGLAGPDLLDSYETERRPHLRQMARVSRLAGALVTPTAPATRLTVDAALRLAAATPGLGPLLREGRVKPAQRLPRRACPPLLPGTAGGGALVGSPVVTGPDGEPARLDELRGPGFALVGIGFDPAAVLDRAARAGWDRVGTAYLELPPGLLAGPRPGEVLVVRPDHVVRGTVPAARLSEATRALLGPVLAHQPAPLRARPV